MKKVLFIIISFALTIIAKPTDYIDGKWYTCDVVETNANGDTVFSSNMYGGKVWYNFNKKNQLVSYKMMGVTCNISYTSFGKKKEEKCSDGKTTSKYTYDEQKRLIKINTSFGITTNYSYDDNGNLIHKNETMHGDYGKITDEYYEYNGNILISSKLTTTDSEGYPIENVYTEYFENGQKKYEKKNRSNEETETWFDSYGNKMRLVTEEDDITYNNEYDNQGRIIFNDSEKVYYKYFKKNNVNYKCIDK